MPYLKSSFTPTTGSTIMIKTTNSSFFNNEVTLTDGTTTLTSAFDADGVCIFSNVFLTGELTASSVNGSNVIKEKINIPHVGATIMRNAIVASTTLNDNDWSTIQAIAKKGSGELYWNVGDRKAITFNGVIDSNLTFTNYTCYAYILGFNHNKEIEGTAIHFQIGFTALTGGVNIALVNRYNTTLSSQAFNMNPAPNSSTITNVGGWASCGMRTVMPALKAAMPSALQSVLKTVSKYSDNVGGYIYNPDNSRMSITQEEVFLLAISEVNPDYFNFNNVWEKAYLKQYSYYALGNTRQKYKHNSSSESCYYWSRSVAFRTSGYWYRWDRNGTDVTSEYSNISLGIAPAFAVG